MILQNWWYTTLLNKKIDFCEPLRKNISCQNLVIGGGIAGLHAALHLVERGEQVVLLERNICGGSSTGKSAGFLTPDSELELSQLIRRYGKNGARQIWSMAVDGVDLIVKTIRKYRIDCDLSKADSLFVGIGHSGKKAVLEEIDARKKLGFKSEYYNEKKISLINKGTGYSAGIKYKNTYAMNALLYAQGLKEVLIKKGMRIYESTEVTEIKNRTAKTHLGSVNADNIIICIDKMKKDFSSVSKEVYSAQTFLAITEPLSNKDIQSMFPKDKVMCWDSKLIYSYYRLTKDNRLLLGGGSALTTFSSTDVTKPNVINSVIDEFKKRFPAVKNIEFIQYWPGRIDTTKDLIPLVDFDKKYPHIQYVLGCVGLPWGAFCGMYAAKRLKDEKYCHFYCEYLKMDRNYLIPYWLQSIIGKKLAFSLNNAFSKYIQR